MHLKDPKTCNIPIVNLLLMVWATTKNKTTPCLHYYWNLQNTMQIQKHFFVITFIYAAEISNYILLQIIVYCVKTRWEFWFKC